MIDGGFFLRVVAAAFATVGIEEYLKNFFQPKNLKWYAVLMLPLAVACFCAAEMLPPAVLGSLLTIGSVQLCYETLIQGFRALIDRISRKMEERR